MGKKVERKLNIGDLVDQFLNWVRGNRSLNTFRMYDGRLKPFKERFSDRRVKSLKPLEIDEFLDSVNKWPDGSEKAPDTIRANITALEQLEKWAIRKQLTRTVFIGQRDKPIGRIRERIPTQVEVDAIKSKASKEFNIIYQALRQCGARPNELARATVADWNREERAIILVHHKTARKTGRPRRITVASKFEALILESLGDRVTGPLFLTPRGNQWTTDSLSQAFTRYRKAAGMPKGVVLYSSRHEHATEISRLHGRDAARDALGHAGGITDRYVHKDPKELRDKQDSVCL